MPNPGPTTSFQSFDREHINMVINIPDYRLRQQLALRHGEELIVEAFVAFGEVFHLHLRWSSPREYPDISLSLACVNDNSQKFVLDVRLQSQQFSYRTGDGAPPQFGICTWSCPIQPIEVQRARTMIPMRLDQAPTFLNDVNVGLEQTIVFTLNGFAWRLDDQMQSSLHCKSYRAWAKEEHCTISKILSATAKRMASSFAAMRGAEDTKPEIEICLEDDLCLDHPTDVQENGGADGCDNENTSSLVEDQDSSKATRRSDTQVTCVMVHAFVLQAHSAVFRRMLAAPMCESVAKTIKMQDVSPAVLEDFIEALYGLAVPEAARGSEERLVGLLRMTDRYEVLALSDECAALLEQLLTEENMARLLKIADMHRQERLKHAALQYITQRTERIVAVMDSDDSALRHIVRSHLEKERERKSSQAGVEFTELLIISGQEEDLLPNLTEEIRV